MFADPDDADAKELLAAVYDRLGYGAENGTWRNFYLTGRRGAARRHQEAARSTWRGGMASALSVEQLFDSIAIRVDGPKAWDLHVTIDWVFTDLDERVRMTLANGVLVHGPHTAGDGADLTLTLTKVQLLGLLGGAGLAGITTSGDPTVLQTVLGVLDHADPDFPIVTP